MMTNDSAMITNWNRRQYTEIRGCRPLAFLAWCINCINVRRVSCLLAGPNTMQPAGPKQATAKPTSKQARKQRERREALQRSSGSGATHRRRRCCAWKTRKTRKTRNRTAD